MRLWNLVICAMGIWEYYMYDLCLIVPVILLLPWTCLNKGMIACVGRYFEIEDLGLVDNGLAKL